MAPIGLIFSGQGSESPDDFARLRQWPGGAEALAALAPALPAPARAWLDGDAPAEALYDNALTQPLVALWQVAAWALLAPALDRPLVATGLSLGALAASHATGALDGAATVALAGRRGAAMSAAAEGRMIATVGAPLDRLTATVAPAGGHVAIVIAADHATVACAAADEARVVAACHAAGATEVRVQPITIPSHSPLMAPAAEALAAALAATPPGRPRFPLIDGVAGDRLFTGARIGDALIRQLTTTLRWDRCMTALAESGCRAVLEIGPGHGLAHALTAAHPDIDARALADFRDPAGAVAWLSRHR